ncbi:hypothetical protein HYU92_01130 [Candidatus Curtissbacteria bacterium]|nr:hypothetical protein [Candidatus Curtissbacteria bacterium]
MNNHFLKITANFFATLILIAILALPLLFAASFTKVAGVKNQSKYLIVSQIDKFPDMTLSQQEDRYKISFDKLGPSQAFLSVLILNNPTNQTQTYSLDVTSGQAKPFFSEDLDNQITKIAVPQKTSVPISLFSGEEATAEGQTIEFTIRAN